jgi:hypothetical protein
MELQIVLKLTMFYAWSGVVYTELLIMIIITLKCSDCIFWFWDSRFFASTIITQHFFKGLSKIISHIWQSYQTNLVNTILINFISIKPFYLCSLDSTFCIIWGINILYISGLCNCYEGYTGIDCRINMNEPPILATDLSNDSLCDTGARACNFISAFGENIYASNNTKCRVETAQVKRFYRYKIN